MDSNMTGRNGRKWDSLSLRKSLGVIVAAMVLLCGGLSAAAMWGCMKIQEGLREEHTIWLSPGDGMYYYTVEGEELAGIVIPADDIAGAWGNSGEGGAEDETFAGAAEWTGEEMFLFRAAGYASILLPILILTAGVAGAAALFYHRKLKKPIALLEDGIGRIGRGDLDFVLRYESGDEMGRLCRTFEQMRDEVLKKNQAMWRMLEERRRINASIAHELRTPLTVIRGYTEYLLKNIQRGRIDTDKLMETLSQLKAASERLTEYTESVRELVSLEDLEVHPEAVPIGPLVGEIREYLKALASGSGISAVLTAEQEAESCLLDCAAFWRVLENLMTNALRYADSRIEVTLHSGTDCLILTVRDDGQGFAKEAYRNAGIPFQNGTGTDGHYGMGLYLCRLLCEKHGGGIEIGGEPGGGGRVTAVFGGRLGA